jgi:hypothetical protein
MLRWIGIFAGTIFLLSQPAAGQQSREAITLKITQDATSYTLTVPVSRLVMTVPKGELQIQRGAASGAGNSPRYFYLATQSAPQLIISGWFESADGFKDIESFWRTETAEWKRRGIAAPRNVSFEHIGAWNAALYDMHGSDVTNTNIRVHWVQSGTWIDIHLSLTGHEPLAMQRQKLREELQSIKVAEKMR